MRQMFSVKFVHNKFNSEQLEFQENLYHPKTPRGLCPHKQYIQGIYRDIFKLRAQKNGHVILKLLLKPPNRSWSLSGRGTLASPTRAAGRLPGPRPQSRHPPAASWLPSWAAPSEAPVGPRRRRLQAGKSRSRGNSKGNARGIRGHAESRRGHLEGKGERFSPSSLGALVS